MIAAAGFVEARIAEDETTAQKAWPGPWATSAEEYEVIDPGDEPPHDVFAGTVIADVVCLSSNQQRATARHIARQNPAQTLANVEADRRILAMWAGHRDRCANGRGYDTDEYTLSALDDVVAHLACRWSNHPDFDPSWRVA